jgi:hypothetical protein
MHGFIRSRHGKFTEFDFPNSPGGTFIQTINSAGTVTGPGWDANGLSHGFVRDPDGNFTQFDPPNLYTGCSGVFNASCGTWPFSINSEGLITGYSLVSKPNFFLTGWVRAADGTITEFGPRSGFAGYWITDAGEISGGFIDSKSVFHGYVRDPDGRITVFNVPGAGTGPFQGTIAGAINEANVSTGGWTDANNVGHGFVRTPDGRITKFDAPGAGTGAGQGTSPQNISAAGTISGFYTDSNNVTHGFIRLQDYDER